MRNIFTMREQAAVSSGIRAGGIRVEPVRVDTISAFRGQGKGDGTQRLLAERKADQMQEESRAAVQNLRVLDTFLASWNYAAGVKP